MNKKNNTPETGDKCIECGSTEFIFCAKCECYECANENCAIPFNRQQ